MNSRNEFQGDSVLPGACHAYCLALLSSTLWALYTPQALLIHNLAYSQPDSVKLLIHYIPLLIVPTSLYPTDRRLYSGIYSFVEKQPCCTYCVHPGVFFSSQRKEDVNQVIRKLSQRHSDLPSALVQVRFNNNNNKSFSIVNCPMLSALAALRNMSNRLSHLTPHDPPHLLRSRQLIKLRIGT